MTSLNAKTEVLKQDARGRVRVSAQRWEALLDKFKCSGMSGAKFARLMGTKYGTFANWVLQRRKRRAAVGAVRIGDRVAWRKPDVGRISGAVGDGGGTGGLDRSAILYTIIECCRRRDLDPFAYLRDVFTRLPSTTNWQVKDLTPEAWAKTQQQVALRAAA